MIQVGSDVEISTPGRRTDGMRGTVLRQEFTEAQIWLYLVGTAPFVDRKGRECSAVWCTLSELREIVFRGVWVRA